jgi:hypothetical protein
MRRYVLLVTLILLTALVPAPASADETYVCWYDDGDNNGVADTALTCRINGSLVITFPSDPPVPTVPEVGIDTNGPCWYRRTGPWSGWLLVQIFPNRDARMWWSASANPNGPFVGDGIYRACINEPRPTPPPITAVWDYIERYPFAVPDPDIAPDGSGVTGLPTYVGVYPPERFATTIASPLGGTIDVEIAVATVTVDWGDGVRASFPEHAWSQLLGYPDGDVHHTYETTALYDLAVSYNWFVRWRIGAGGWQPIPVPPTTWTRAYRIDELVGRRTG